MQQFNITQTWSLESDPHIWHKNDKTFILIQEDMWYLLASSAPCWYMSCQDQDRLQHPCSPVHHRGTCWLHLSSALYIALHTHKDINVNPPPSSTDIISHHSKETQIYHSTLHHSLAALSECTIRVHWGFVTRTPSASMCLQKECLLLDWRYIASDQG